MRNRHFFVFLSVCGGALLSGCGGGSLSSRPVPVSEVQFDGPGESGIYFSGGLEQYSGVDLPIGKTRWDFDLILSERREAAEGGAFRSSHISVHRPDQLILSVNGTVVDLYGLEAERECWFSPCYSYQGSVLVDNAPEGYDVELVFHASRTASVNVHIEPPQFSITPITEDSPTDVTHPVMVTWDTNVVYWPELNIGTFELDLDSLLIDESPADRGVVADSPDCSRTVSERGLYSNGPMQGTYAAGFDCPEHNWSFFRLTYDDQVLYRGGAAINDYEVFKDAYFYVKQRSEIVYWPLAVE